jgi:hypothetical protein
MTHDPLDRVTQLLREASADPGDVDALPAGRDEAVERLADALRARAARRTRQRRLFGLGAAAAAFAIVSGGVVATRPRASSAEELGRVSPGDTVAAVRDGRTVSLGAGARVAEGTELRTLSGSEAHLEFDTGTHVTLGGATRVRLIEQTRNKRFAIESGVFSAKVAKLSSEERFLVTTPDTEVEVRGTVFRVELVTANPSCAAGTPTRVEVSEGVVVIRHGGEETRVAAGERWPDCAASEVSADRAPPPPPSALPTRATAVSAAPPAPVPTVAAPAPALTVAAPAASVTTAPPVDPPKSSDLSEQNDLFDRAMRDKRAGRGPQALAALDRLLARYPEGPLVESATVERFRLRGCSEKARAAREYLSRWPHGFARAEAEALSSGP